MADNVSVTAGSGVVIAADECVDATLGTVKFQYVKIADGTLDGTNKAAVGANGLAVDVKAAVITSGTITAVTAISNALPSGTNVIGHVIADSGSTTAVTGNVTAVQSTGSNLHTVVDSGTVTTVSTVTNLSQEGGAAVSLNAGAVDTGTRRVVQANGAGKTILSTGGSASSSGNNTIVAAGTNKLKVFAFSLSTTSATAVTCIFQSGASGTELWRVVLMAPSGANSGANLAVSPPAWLFATASATLLNLNLSSANAVNWSVSYYDEA